MYNRRGPRTLLSVIAVGGMGLLLVLAPGSARAQAEQPSTKPEQVAQAQAGTRPEQAAQAPAATKPRAKAVEVEEITVTARKREERVQEVPVAVTALTSEMLEQAKPANLSDLSGAAPNLTIKNQTSGPRASNIYIRGLGYSDIEKTQSPSVGVMVDGIAMGTSTGQILDTFDVQQVEVDRGPQGLFEGKNTTGGLIKVTRSRPTMDWGFKGSIGYGDFDDTTVRATLNIPVIKDVVGWKIGASYHERDGYYRNLYNGPSNGAVKSYDMTSAVLIKPGFSGVAGNLLEDFEALFVFDFVRDKSEIVNPVQFGDDLSGSIFQLPGNPNNLGPHDTLSDFPEHSYLNLYRGSVAIKFDTPIGRVASITGYLGEGDDQWEDFDGTCGTDLQGNGCNFPQTTNFLVPVLHTKRDASYWQFSQELHLETDLSKNGFIGRIPGEVNLLTGVFYWRHNMQHKQLTSVATGADPKATYVEDLSRQDSGEKDNSYAPFMNLSWKKQFNRPGLYSLSASAGARYVYEKKEFNTMFSLPAYGGLVIVPRVSQTNDWDRWLSRVDLTWGITEYNLAYFNRADGFRSGGFSIRGTLSEQIVGQTNCPNGGTPGSIACPDNDYLSFKPEKVATYELGTKNEFFNGAMTFNFAGFYTEVTGQQQSFVVTTGGYGPGTNTYINNYQSTTIKGVEADVVVAPPFIPGFTLAGSVGYQDEKVDEAVVDNRRLPLGPGATAGCHKGDPGCTATSNSTDLANGAVILNVPDYNYAITGTYRVPIGPTEFTIGLTWRYTDDMAVGNLGSIGEFQEGYGLLDGIAQLSYDRYTFALFAHNITDKVYLDQSLPSVYFRYYGYPRTVNGEFTVKF